MTSAIPNLGPLLKRPASNDLLSNSTKRQRKSDVSKPTPIGVTLKKEYIEQIRDGLLQKDGIRLYKTVEARIHNRVFVNVREGSLLDFFYMSKRKDNVICRIVKKTVYPDFSSMLLEEGVRNCLPKLKEDQLQRAVAMYEAIPGYANKLKKFGVVALKLEAINHPSLQ